jgi:hypothetical protein
MFARGRSNQAFLVKAFQKVSGYRDSRCRDNVALSTLCSQCNRIAETLVVFPSVGTPWHTARWGVPVALTVTILQLDIQRDGVGDLPVGGDELTIHESAVVGAATVESNESTSVIPGDHAKRSQLASPVTAVAETVLWSLAPVAGDWQVRPTTCNGSSGCSPSEYPDRIATQADIAIEQERAVRVCLFWPPSDRADLSTARPNYPAVARNRTVTMAWR